MTIKERIEKLKEEDFIIKGFGKLLDGFDYIRIIKGDDMCNAIQCIGKINSVETEINSDLLNQELIGEEAYGCHNAVVLDLKIKEDK